MTARRSNQSITSPNLLVGDVFLVHPVVAVGQIGYFRAWSYHLVNTCHPPILRGNRYRAFIQSRIGRAMAAPDRETNDNSNPSIARTSSCHSTQGLPTQIKIFRIKNFARPAKGNSRIFQSLGKVWQRSEKR